MGSVDNDIIPVIWNKIAQKQTTSSVLVHQKFDKLQLDTSSFFSRSLITSHSNNLSNIFKMAAV